MLSAREGESVPWTALPLTSPLLTAAPAPPYRRLKLDHRFPRIPHAFKVRIELRGCASVANHDEIIVLRVFAACAEIRRARAELLPVDRIGLQVHKRAAALDPYGVGEVAELYEVMTFARVEDDPDCDAAPVGGVKRVENYRVRERIPANLAHQMQRGVGGHKADLFGEFAPG